MLQKYLGITPYDENESFEFVGRTEEIWALYDRIYRNDYTVYYAASGEGKSSLIRAGLLPILRRRDYFPIYIVFDDQELNDSSSIFNVIDNRIRIEELKHGVTFEQSSWSKMRFNEEQSAILEKYTWWKLRNYCFKKGDKELKPFYIFDQFEEVFTKATYEWTDNFFSWLEDISTDYVPDSLKDIISSMDIYIPTQKNFKALFSFRTEYLGDLDYWCVQKHFLPSLQDNRMCLKPLTPKGAMEVIDLNKEALGVYTEKIIQGCTEPGVKNGNNNQPCVYALILSVVCQTLSSVSDRERLLILDNLSNNREGAIDDVLLNFYKKKLKEAGLDILKDEHIIAEIEDALVNENGKRNRRETNEKSLQPLSKWIERLCEKDNGLLKIIGSRKEDGKIVKTVEFPHDRLCKAIDSSRKERQGRKAWTLKRQTEWMQFSIMIGVVIVVSYLWNTMMEEIKLVMYYALSNKFEEIPESDGFYAALLMLLLFLILPLQIFSISKKNLWWLRTSAIISIISAFIYGFICYKNQNIEYQDGFIPFITLLALLSSIAILGVSVYKIYNIKKISISHIKIEESSSVWPILGGLLFFLVYIFHGCLFRLTFGTNEVVDSAWCIIAIPSVLYFLIWSYFNLRIVKSLVSMKSITVSVIIFFVSLIVLFIVNMIPSYNAIKQSIGFPLSIIFILVAMVSSTFVFLRTESKSKYIEFTKIKQIGSIVCIILILVSVFILNLGYNPIRINPSNVCYVNNWRSVIVCNHNDSTSYLGLVEPLSGDVVFPCCADIKEEYDSLLNIGEYPFSTKYPLEVFRSVKESPFIGTNKRNDDGSLFLVQGKNTINGLFVTSAVFEKYLYNNRNKPIEDCLSLNDSIIHYASNLYNDLRQNNLEYIITGKTYDIDKLKSINLVDSLQSIAFLSQIETIKDSVPFSRFNKNMRPLCEVMEDINLVDLYKELTRSMLISIIRDRVSHKDMPALFQIARTYPLAFFPDIEGFSTNTSIEFGSEGYSYSNTIYSYDVNKKRLFSWYNLFDCICKMDNNFNSDKFSSSVVSKIISDYNEKYDKMKEKTQIAIEILEEDSTENSKKTIAGLQRIQDNINACINLYNNVSHDNISIADSKLSIISENMIQLLMELMRKDYNAIYNNAFESTIQNLILVSLMRGHEIETEIQELSYYHESKNKYYDYIVNAKHNNIKEISTLDIQFQKQYKEFDESMEELIKQIKQMKQTDWLINQLEKLNDKTKD